MFKPFHLLGERIAIGIYHRLQGTRIESCATTWKGYGLFPLTIAGVARMIRDSGFDISDVDTRLSPVNTARLPGFLKDLASWHVCYVARSRS